VIQWLENQTSMFWRKGEPEEVVKAVDTLVSKKVNVSHLQEVNL